jgi:hypothetical protein
MQLLGTHARGAIGDETYRRENAAFRDSGRRLSGVRDASILIETLDELERVSGDDLPRGAADSLRERLERVSRHSSPCTPTTPSWRRS